MVDESIQDGLSSSGGYDPEDLKSDRYDLISSDLERYILAYPGDQDEGEAVLRLLYELNDKWTGYVAYHLGKKTDYAKKGARPSKLRKAEALEWYLTKGEKLRRRYNFNSYTKLSVALETSTTGSPDGQRHAKSAATIADYLLDAAREWYVDKAEDLVLEDPHASIDEIVNRLKEMAQQEMPIFCLSRKCDIKTYIDRPPLELWRLAGLSGAAKMIPLSRRL